MKINTEFSTIYISAEIQQVLTEVLKKNQNRKTFVLVDENTKKHCLPIINSIVEIDSSEIIEIKSGEKNKSIKSLEKVWTMLSEKGADRLSLLINLGGGIICDLGGFAASTFKRGIDFINIPTTLLSQVDASVGGKTGVNLHELKNEIGVFNHPKYVLIDSSFNRTLEKDHILSGWAEMLKHSLIFDEKDWLNVISHDIKHIGFKELNKLIARSINIKNHFVEQDPFEKNIRKALNFGHTFGHAFESLFMNSESEISHGEAVAHGMICELYLSGEICNFPAKKTNTVVTYLLNIYNKVELNDSDFENIIVLIGHDKKKEGQNINFTLLEDFGKIKINQNCDRELLIKTLNWYKSL
jgi:3-dehydroquinate synthase